MTTAVPRETDVTTFTTLGEFFTRVIPNEAVVDNIIDSITFDARTQRVIIQMQRLVREEADVVASQHYEVEGLMAEIRRLSERYRENYPQLLEHFREWKPAREKLVKLLFNSSNKLGRNSTFSSYFRILTSAADIVGTFARIAGKSEESWANFAMANASGFGLLSHFVEHMLSKKIHRDVIKAIKADQDIFKKIVEWFKQSEDLDSAVRSFFPYGMDAEIVKKIDRCSSTFDDYNKIFISIVASNVRKNAKLLTDIKFLDKADRFATSEAGKQWFYKILLKDDPFFSHWLNSNLSKEISTILKTSSTSIPELFFGGCRMLPEVQMKSILNVMIIISAGNNLLCGSKSEESERLKDVSEDSKKELREINNVITLLKPSDLQLDQILL